MRLKDLDLFLGLLIALINVGLILLPGDTHLEAMICALPLVLFIPGYMLVEALFVRSPAPQTLIRKPVLHLFRPLRRSDRLILSLGLSLALVIISGFVLNILPMGLQRTTWAVFLACLIAVFSLIAFFRRKKTDPVLRRITWRNAFSRVMIYNSILCLIAVAIVVFSLWYSILNASQQQQQSTFTQFWMEPSRQAKNSCDVLIGLQSFEATTVMYDVVVTANDAPLATWRSVEVAPEQQWYQSVVLPPEHASTVEIKAQLYKHGEMKTAYREVHVTFHTTGAGTGRAITC